jgi:hypothetical protein
MRIVLSISEVSCARPVFDWTGMVVPALNQATTAKGVNSVAAATVALPSARRQAPSDPGR